jgi:hypothetical protein
MSDVREERLAAMIRDAIVPIEPPAGLEARVLGATAPVEAEGPVRRSRSRRRTRPVLAFATAVAVSLVVAVLLRGGSVDPLELSAVLTAPDRTASASVEVRKTGIGRVVTFDSDSLPILPKGEYYELWFVGPGDRPGRPNRISAGTFHPDEDGRSHVVFAAAVDPALYPSLVVTAEPGDGDPSPSRREVLRHP